MASMIGREEKQVLAAYLVRNRLKRSAQREAILDAFLRAGRHVSVEELLGIVRKKRADIGRTTIYRLLAEGRLEAVHVGRALRIPVTSVEDFVHQLQSEEGTT